MVRSRFAPAALCVSLLSLVAPAIFAAVPAGFSDNLVTNIGSPTAIAFTPDGRLLITTQGGTLRVYPQGGPILATPALTIPASQICSNSERGLLGVAVDPAFAANRFIYVFYTFETLTSACVNRVSRFTLPDSNVVDIGTEVVLVDNMPSPAGNHNAGDVQFGRDGYLYISIGDGGCDYANNSGCAGANDAARDEHVLTGKILRITSDGNIPPTNPFQGAGTARCNVTGSTTPGNRCQETFAWGLRNPFRIAFDPNAVGTRFFINDVGQGAWEEFDLGQAGADYGWNCREGAHTNNVGGPCNPAPAGMVDPIFEYAHGAQVPGTTSPTFCNSITGGAFVPNGLWPGFDGKYLFSDFVCGWIFAFTEGGMPFPAADFATNLGSSSAVTLRFGPFGTTQALYATTYAGGGQVRRIVFDNPVGNDPPTAMASAMPTSGAVPLNVTFDATGSTDPDAGETLTLTYFWDFGDGTPETSTTNLTIMHNYTSAGVFTASLRARDSNFVFSQPVTLQIQPGNTPPTPAMSSPAALSTFAAGQTLTLTGSATDSQDGSLPSSGLSWQVLLHHNNDHTHPFLGPLVGNNIPFAAPNPEDLAAVAGSYLEIILTATDSGGLATLLARDIQPRRVDLTFATSPPGLALTLNAGAIAAPQIVTSWEGYALQVAAAHQSDGMGGSYVFLDWSDGGEPAHSIVTPAANTTYTARFKLSADSGAMQYYTVPPCRALDTRLPDGPLGGPVLTAGAARPLALSGVCTIPPAAVAIAGNFTVVQPTATGVLRAFPASDPATATSVLGVRAGVTRAGSAVVGVDAATALTLLLSAPTGTAHVVVDIVGYFAP